MPEIQAFRGIRYDLGHVGSLGDVIAPPYDVIDPELQAALYKQHPCNVVRLILNRIEPGDDDEANNRYTRARRFLKQWQSQGVLFTEADPAIYVYHQQFDEAGVTYTRRGFMTRLRVSPFGKGSVFPHEETMSGPKLDRLMLTTVCKANLSPIFGLYPDPANEAQELLETAIAGVAPIEATDHLGVVHRMWPVSDVSVISAVSAAMSPKPVFIADGHHRYETACNYREQIRDSGFLKDDHPANFVLMMCVGMDDPGMRILATHRLFGEVGPFSSDELIAKLSPCFTVQAAAQGAESAPLVWEQILLGDDQTTIGLYAAKDRQWVTAELTEPGRARMAEVAPDHGEDWRELGASILHRLIVATLLDPQGKAELKYVHPVEDVVSAVASGEFPLAALVMPAGIQHVRDISLRGERMPPKSTYFYPKLLSGLVLNPLE